MTARARLAAASMLCALSCLLAGCGVGPSGISSAGQAPTGVAPGPTLYFLDSTGRLVPQLRETGQLGTIGDALTLLLDGPGGSQLHTGIESVGVDRVQVTDARNLIELTLPLASDEVSRQGVEQIVCTALGVNVQSGGSRRARVRLILTEPGPPERRLWSCPLLGR